jgi:hypothetical protein
MIIAKINSFLDGMRSVFKSNVDVIISYTQIKCAARAQNSAFERLCCGEITPFSLNLKISKVLIDSKFNEILLTGVFELFISYESKTKSSLEK